MRSISLLPPEARTLRSTVIPNNVLILAAVIVVVCASGGYYAWNLSNKISTQRNSALNSNAQLAPLNQFTGELSIRAAALIGVNSNQLRQTVISVNSGRPNWAKLLGEIYGATGSAAISTMSLQTPGTSAVSSTGTTQSSGSFDVSITGSAPSQKVMVDFVRSLRRLPSVTAATLLSSVHAQEGKEASNAVTFSVGVDLKALSAPAYLSKAVGTAAGGTP
jgi:hypothetical protein